MSMQMSFLEVTQACRDKADAYWHTHTSPTWQGFEADGQLDWIRMLGDVGIGTPEYAACFGLPGAMWFRGTH